MNLSARRALWAAAVFFLLGGPLHAAEDADVPKTPYSFVTKAKQGTAPIDTDRVFGGWLADPGEWPWQVALLRTDYLSSDPQSQFDAQFCGGSLIADDVVLTAAHCVFDDFGGVILPEDVTILVGATSLDEGTRVKAVDVIPYPGFSESTLDGDLALIRLEADSASAARRSGARTGKVKLAPVAAQYAENTPVVVTGWGKMENGAFPADLLETEIELVSNATCNRAVHQLYARELPLLLARAAFRLRIPSDDLQQVYEMMLSSAQDPITDGMLCAGTPSGIRDACNGDSGGPLMIVKRDGVEQIGIVSWGEGPLDSDVACGNEQLYGYYTNIAAYRDWIDKQLE